MGALVIDGKCMIPEEEIKASFVSKCDTYKFALMNDDGTVRRSEYIENEIQKFFDNLKSEGKRVTKFIGYVDYCDESILEGHK